MMKQGIRLIVFALYVGSSLAFAQVDKSIGTVTDDATQARLRVGNFVFGSPNTDVLVNGEIAVNGGVVQADLPSDYVGGYMYLEPGTYSVAVVPTGEGMNEALIGPLDIPLEAGHRYTLAMMGQLTDESLKPLVMDDTEILHEARTDPGQGIMILVNNLAGTERLSFTIGGQGPKAAPYGGFAAAPLSVPFGKPLKITTDVGIIADEEAGVGQDPAMDFTVAFYGRFPGEAFRDTQSPNTSDLSTIAFLQKFSGLGFEWDGQPISFDTFLGALKTSGLTEVLETGGPHVLFPPTDEAFAALPKNQLDALMANPKALADMLRYHIVEGYYPRGGLTGEDGHTKVLTNLLGMELELQEGIMNGTSVGELQSYMVANGSRVGPITAVLLPPSQ